tara:strand:+ start:1953 stop:2453 length:501 start_codon:yes stop_codon:yes gene_type:complete
MGKYKDKNGTTKVGDFLRGVKNVAPDILELAGNITGIEVLGVLGDKIKGSDTLTPIEKETALHLLKIDMAELKDVQSARNMYSSTDHDLADYVAKRVINYNLWVVLIAIVIEIISVIFIDDKVLIAIISGAIGSATTALLQERQQVISFLFGSSRGSKEKTDLMKK